jgi:indole-3-glycerol phosphate synthase
MATVLDTIIQRKHEEVALLKQDRAAVRSGAAVSPHRKFVAALDAGASLGLIAEVKKGSPSKGVIRADFDPVAIARSYERGGANAVSVLTDERFFFGAPRYVPAVREAVGLPILRKDFIIDIIQVEQTVALGADAMLLIAAALDDVQLRDLYDAACGLGIEPLIEIHNHRELDRVMKIEPPVIGINNRDLATFVTDLNVTLELLRHIPRSITVVSESGIDRGEQARMLRSAGVRALLVGESLMRKDDPAPLMAELRGI